ncbi:MAG: AAA family ATPase [Chitinophagales bacterium]
MRITYLEIPSYKNLEDIKLHFNAELVTLLIGKNGLGKSNLLEIIAYIFSSIDLAEKEEDFTIVNDNVNSPKLYEFIIEYDCKDHSIHFSVIDNKLVIKVKNIKDKEYQEIDFKTFKRDKLNYTPDYIIGYYSGENSRIKKFFQKHKTKRINNIKKRDNDQNFPALGRLFFTEENCGELLFFTLSMFRNDADFKDKIDDLLYNYLEIDEKSKVAIAFNNPGFYNSYKEKSVDKLISNLLDKNSRNNFWGITGKIDDFISLLYDNNLDEPNAYRDEEESIEDNINEFIIIDKIKYKELIKNLPKFLKDPIHFFDILHSAYELGIIYKIYGELIKNGQSLSLNYSELSEGEQQMLTVLGLILIAGRDDCLFLLDEPDTHLNPNWQRDLIEHIKEFNINDNNSHIFLATHSPLVVQSSMEKDDVFVFKKDKDEKVEIEKFEHHFDNWRIDQVLLSSLFDIDSARPKHLDPFMKKREELLAKPNLTIEDIEYLEKIDNEIGHLPTGETLNDFQTMHLLRKIVSKSKINDKNK